MPVPLVLVHDLRGSSVDWASQVAAFEAHGHAVTTIDLPGHGRRIDEPFSIGESLVTIAEAVGASGGLPLVIGRGLGAHLGIEAASHLGAVSPPEGASAQGSGGAAVSSGGIGAVSGVVAIGCGTQALGWVLDSYRIASASHTLLPDDGAAMSALASSTFVRAGKTGSVAMSEHFGDTLRQLDDLDTPGALARLEVPVWLVNGQYDLFRFQERAFLRAARSARLIRQPGVRLAGRFTRPTETNRLLSDIVDSVVPTL